MGEYDKKIQFKVDVTPVLDRNAALKVKESINNNGKGVDLDVNIKKKVGDRINKELKGIIDKYMKARQKAQDVGQYLTDMQVGKMSEEDFNKSKKQIIKLVNEHKKAALEMTKINRQLSQSLSTMGVDFNDKGLQSIGIENKELIKMLTTFNTDMKGFEKIASQIRTSGGKYSKRTSTLTGFTYGDLNVVNQSAIESEYKELIKAFENEDMKLREYFRDANVKNAEDFLKLPEDQIRDFEKQYKKIERIYTRLMNPDYKSLIKQDETFSYKEKSLKKNKDYYDMIPSKQVTEIDNATQNIQEILADETNVDIQALYHEYERASEAIEKIKEEKEKAEKELEKARAKSQKEQARAKELKEANDKVKGDAETAITTTRMETEEEKAERLRKKAAKEQSKQRMKLHYEKKDTTETKQPTEQTLNAVSLGINQIQSELDRIAKEPNGLNEKFAEVKPTLEQNVKIMNEFYNALTKVNAGGETLANNLMKVTEQFAANELTEEEMLKQYNNLLKIQSAVSKGKTSRKKNIPAPASGGSGGNVPPPAPTSGGGGTPPSGGNVVSGGNDGGYTARITDFEITEEAKIRLADKIKAIEGLTAKISDFEIGDVNLSENVQEKMSKAFETLTTSNIKIPKIELKNKDSISVLKQAISDELGTIEVKNLNFKKALEKFKNVRDEEQAKKNTPIKVSATISKFTIGKGALPGLRQRLARELKNIKVSFKYNLDVIVSEEAKTAAEKQVNALKNNFKEAKKQVDSLANKINNSRNNIQNKYSKGKKAGYLFSDDEKNLDDQLTNLSNQLNNLAKPAIDADEAAIKTYIEEVNKIADAYKNVQNAATQTFNKIDSLVKSNKDEQANIKLQKSWNDELAGLQKYLQNNPRLKESVSLNRMYESLISDLQNLDRTPENLTNIKKGFSELKLGMRQANLEGKTFTQTLKGMFEKFGSWGIVTRIMMLGYNTVKKMFQATKEVDTAMVNLRKVSDETESTYVQFLKNASKEAKALGTTITELTEATATFARLGYSLSDSTELGKIATMYSKVAEGLSSEDASNSIVSTMKAFKISADEAEKIVDEFNYVGRLLPLYIAICIEQMTISVNVQRWTRPR